MNHRMTWLAGVGFCLVAVCIVRAQAPQSNSEDVDPIAVKLDAARQKYKKELQLFEGRASAH